MIIALAAAVAVAQAPATPCPDLVTPQAFVCRALRSTKAGDPEARDQDERDSGHRHLLRRPRARLRPRGGCRP